MQVRNYRRTFTNVNARGRIDDEDSNTFVVDQVRKGKADLCGIKTIETIKR